MPGTYRPDSETMSTLLTLPPVRGPRPTSTAGRRLSAMLRVEVLATLGAGVAMLGMLAALLLVARQAVRQGESRRQAVALVADATWRCQALRDAVRRASCLAPLPRDLPHDDAGLKALVASIERPPSP
jgi:hypothetical protein